MYIRSYARYYLLSSAVKRERNVASTLNYMNGTLLILTREILKLEIEKTIGTSDDSG